MTIADHRTPGPSAAKRGSRGKLKAGKNAHTPYGTPAGTPMSTCSQVTFSLMYPQPCSIGMEHFLNAKVLGLSVVCIVVWYAQCGLLSQGACHRKQELVISHATCSMCNIQKVHQHPVTYVGPYALCCILMFPCVCCSSKLQIT